MGIFGKSLVFAIVAAWALPTWATRPPATEPAPAQKRVPTASDAIVKEKASTYLTHCAQGQETTVERISRKYREEHEASTAPEREAAFYIASCQAGAYNRASVLFSEDSSGGLEAVPLAVPIFKESSLKIIGWAAEMTTGDLRYDSASNVMTAFFKGRGVGDLSTTVRYSIFQRMVVLREYLYDGTADGRVNAKTVFVTKETLSRK